MREKQFEEKVKRYLESVGVYRLGTPKDQMPVKPRGYWLKRWGGAKYIPAGCPDMQITIGAFNVDVELKNEKGKLDPMQHQKLNQIKDAGGFCMVLRPKDFEAFKDWVSQALTREEQLKATGEIPRGCEIGASELQPNRDVRAMPL